MHKSKQGKNYICTKHCKCNVPRHLCSQVSIYPRFYVLRNLCSQSHKFHSSHCPMFPRTYFLCIVSFHGPMFPGSYFTKVLCSQEPTFPRRYVSRSYTPRVLCFQEPQNKSSQTSPSVPNTVLDQFID